MVFVGLSTVCVDEFLVTGDVLVLVLSGLLLDMQEILLLILWLIRH